MANPNKIRLVGGIIRLTVKGEQDFDAADATVRRLDYFVSHLRLQGRPALILSNARQVGGQSPAARSRSKEFLKHDFDKMAIVGIKGTLYYFTLFTAGKLISRKVELFRTEQSAIKWLESDTREHDLNRHKPFATSPYLLFVTILLGVFLSSLVFAKLNDDTAHLAKRRAATASHDAAHHVEGKLEAYVATLYGFKSYFASSTNITQKGFHDYFIELNIQERYPGITAFSYIREVSSGEKDDITDRIRNDESIFDSQLRDFSIRNDRQHDIYYPLVYIEPQPANANIFGADFNISPARLAVLQKARSTGKPAASKSFTMMNGNTQSDDRGFLISIPVFGGFDPASSGYINVVFSYRQFFSNASILHRDAYQITDPDGQPVFRSPKIRTGQVVVADYAVDVVDRTWQLQLFGDDTFGLSSTERNNAKLTLATLITIIILLALVSVNLLRSRHSAVALAGQITEDLQILEHRQSLMIQSIKDYAICMIDIKGRIASWNSGAEIIMGYKESDILGKHMSIFYRKQERSKAAGLLQRARKKGNAELIGWRVRKDGSEFWARVAYTAVRDENGSLIGYTAVAQDLSRQQHLEKERDNFIAMATHELKAPITAIKVYAQVLQRKFSQAGDQPSSDLLGRMDGQIDHLSKLANDLLDISKIETGQLEYEMRPLDVNRLVAETVKSLSRTFKPRVIRLHGHIDKQVSGDPGRIEQVLTNLIDNAAKYSPASTEIHIDISAADSYVQIAVTDFGAGVKPADRSRIFERYFRADQARHSPGFGLGLYLCTEIIHHHGGKLTVVSRKGKGSTFTIHIPYPDD